MGQTVDWAVNHAMPEALERLGYRADDPVALITFDSTAERVLVDGRDPTVAELRTIGVKLRGKTTLMAQAVQLLGQLLSNGGPFNVFVISDGFLRDMPQALQRVEAEVPRVPVGARVAFALFRFFNGKPPDTQALAAVASLGTMGSAPCTDCVVRRGQLEAAMRDFVTTAEEAFTAGMGRHALLEGQHMRRLPSLAEAQRFEVPCEHESLFYVNAPLDELRLNGQLVDIECARELGPAITDYAGLALAQLRLWLVGRLRCEGFEHVTRWFRQLAEQQDRGSGPADMSLLGRAAALRRRRADDESPLARIEALAEARAFVGELNSKQQGDFLRGGSVARADRLLARRSLGSDIAYHDAVRQALGQVALPVALQAEEGADCEATHASLVGGSSYTDALRAAALLAPLAEDLAAAEILQVIGGLGVPFVARVSALSNDPWALDVTAADAGSWLAESDVWAARATGEPVCLAGGEAVVGVAPLALCGSAAHAAYVNGPLRPVALLHLASQLRGQLPEKAWGWDPKAPPFSLDDGVAAREAAVLCFLAGQCFGGAVAPSEAEATVALQLLAQLRGWSGAAEASAPLMVEGCCPGLDARTPTLRHLTAALVATDELPAQTVRALYDLEVRSCLHKEGEALGLPAHAVEARRGAALSLLAGGTNAQGTPLARGAVLQRLQGLLSGLPAAEDPGMVETAPVHDDTLASDRCLAERLRKLRWLPSTQRLLGVVRIQRTDPAARHPIATEFLSLDAAFFGAEAKEGEAWTFAAASVAAALLGDGPGFLERTRGPLQAREELRRLLRTALAAEYEGRLRHEVAQLLVQQREEARRRLQASGPIGSGEAPAEELCLEAIQPLVPVGWGRPGTQPHVSCAFCGDAMAGKSTAVGRLLYELGCIPRRMMEEHARAARSMGRQPSAFAFAMDRMRKERECGATISATKGNFFTDRWHYTVIDCPGRKHYLKSTCLGIAQADVAVLMVPADGHLQAAIAKGSHKLGLPRGQAREHAMLLFVYGITQLIVCVTKMDSQVAGYREERFEEAVKEVKDMLVSVGWKREVVDWRVPFIPVAGWAGGNLVRASDEMPWWRGCAVQAGGAGSCTVSTLAAALNDAVVQPERSESLPLRLPITGVFKIKGVGDVVTGRIAQGTVKMGEELSFGTTGDRKCTGKVFSCEMHHRQHENPSAGDIVGLCLKGLSKDNMPCVGDVLHHAPSTPLAVRSFTALIQVLSVPNQLGLSWTPICFVHTAHMAVRLTRVLWKMGSSTRGERRQDPEPQELCPGDVASVNFAVPLPRLRLEPFAQCPSLGRVVLVDGKVVMAMGKVTAICS